jgi:hypothetical protein
MAGVPCGGEVMAELIEAGDRGAECFGNPSECDVVSAAPASLVEKVSEERISLKRVECPEWGLVGLCAFLAFIVDLGESADASSGGLGVVKAGRAEEFTGKAIGVENIVDVEPVGVRARVRETDRYPAVAKLAYTADPHSRGYEEGGGFGWMPRARKEIIRLTRGGIR